MLRVNNLVGFSAGIRDTPIKFVGAAAGGGAGTGTGARDVSLNGTLTGGIDVSPSTGDLIIAAYAIGSTADRACVIQDIRNSGTPYNTIGSELYGNDTYDTNLRVGWLFHTGNLNVAGLGVGSVSDGSCLGALVFRGVNAVTPMDVAAVTATGINSGLADPPPITPVTYGSIIVAVGACARATGSGVLFSSPELSGFISASGSDANAASVGLGYKVWKGGGAFDPAAFALSAGDSTSNSWAAVTVALRPA